MVNWGILENIRENWEIFENVRDCEKTLENMGIYWKVEQMGRMWDNIREILESMGKIWENGENGENV